MAKIDSFQSVFQSRPSRRRRRWAAALTGAGVIMLTGLTATALTVMHGPTAPPAELPAVHEQAAAQADGSTTPTAAGEPRAPGEVTGADVALTPAPAAPAEIQRASKADAMRLRSRHKLAAPDRQIEPEPPAAVAHTVVARTPPQNVPPSRPDIDDIVTASIEAAAYPALESEAADPEPVSEAVEPASAASDPEPVSEAADPVPVSKAAADPEPVSEAVEPASAASDPEPVSEAVEPASAPADPEPMSEAADPEAESEAAAPEPVAEAADPEPEPAESSPAEPDEASRTAPVNDDVNMRAGPSNGARVITVVPNGTRVEVIDCDYWCRVDYAGKRGWIYKSFIRGAS